MKSVIFVKSNRPPIVEIDEQALAAYVRFNRGSVAKTIELPSPRGTVTVDFDQNEKVLGVELIGVREFTISALLKRVPQIQPPKVNLLNKARYISAAHARSQTANDDLVPASI